MKTYRMTGKIISCFRELYNRNNKGLVFKFFNTWYYLSEAVRIDVTLTVNE